MIEINLLPSGEGGRGAKRKSAAGSLAPKMSTLPFDPWKIGVGIAVVAALLLLGFTHWRTTDRIETLSTEIAEMQRDSARHSDFLERSTLYEQQIEVIREIDDRRYVWAHILDEVSHALPPHTWLTQVRATGDGGSLPGFSIEGNAATTQALTSFMTRLGESPFIQSVNFITSNQVQEEGRTFYRFALEARYRQAEPEFVETVPLIVVSE